MTAVDFLARFVGAFYALGGIFAIRAVLVDDVLDKALLSLTGERPTRRDIVRRWMLWPVSVLTCLSGVALLALSLWAVPLFLANLAIQVAWLVWARDNDPPKSDEDVLGRRRTRNAAATYSVATAAVCWLAGRGFLLPFDDRFAAGVLLLAMLGIAVWLLRHLAWEPAAPADGPDDVTADEDPDPLPAMPPQRLRVVLRQGYHSLWNADDGRALGPAWFLPADLKDRIEVWENAYEDSFDLHDPAARSGFDRHAAEAHAAEGRAIVAELEAILGPGMVEGPFYDEAEAAECARIAAG